MRLSLAAACALLFALPCAASSKDSVPDWVRTAASQTLTHYSPETNAVVILDDCTYSVSPDGRAVEHVRRVVKILRPQGRNEATFHVDFDKDTKILTMRVWAIGPDGHEYAMKDNEFEDKGYSGGGVAFEDDRYRVARAPGADPGGVVAIEYEQRRRPYFSEHTQFFQEDIPSVSQSFTLELPPGFIYTAVWANHAAVQGTDIEQGRWRWEMQNVPGIDLDSVPMSPSYGALESRMTIHYAGPSLATSSDGTWKGIGEWFDTLSKDRLVATPEIAAKAKDLTAGKSDFYDRTEAIGEFVQRDVRYVAIEVGVGGYQPHAAGDVFRNRYGDCKDKATLVSAMLSTIGIHAALMMVDTHRGVVIEGAPSMVGNHMIAAIEVPADYNSPRLHSLVTATSGRRYLIFDPTWDKIPFGQLENNLQGSYGILMEGAQTQAIQLPLLDPALNTIHRTASFSLAADGVLKGTVVERRFGDLAEMRREVYTSGDAREQRDFLDHALQRDFTTVSATDVKTENVAALNKDFTLSYTLSADRYARNIGSLMMVRPRVLGSLGMNADHRKRLVPIDLGETMQARDEYDIALPEGYIVDEVPDPVKLDLGFAAYESATVFKGNTLHYTRTYTVRQVTLPADRYADVQKLAGVIEADEQSRAVFKKQ
jgi:hypothetical protein